MHQIILLTSQLNYDLNIVLGGQHILDASDCPFVLHLLPPDMPNLLGITIEIVSIAHLDDNPSVLRVGNTNEHRTPMSEIVAAFFHSNATIRRNWFLMLGRCRAVCYFK